MSYRNPGGWRRQMTIRDYVHELTDEEVRILRESLELYLSETHKAAFRRIAHGLLFCLASGQPPIEPEHLKAWRAEERGYRAIDGGTMCANGDKCTAGCVEANADRGMP